MRNLLEKIEIKVSPSLYSKDPLSSELGKSILKQGTILINETGFEHFNFKKLASTLSTTESSIYRYFENKHKLVLYLLSWYWGFMEYLIVFSGANISEPKERLRVIIKCLISPVEVPTHFDYINDKELNKIVFEQSARLHHSDDSDTENIFLSYDGVCSRVADIIKEINPKYEYPKSLSIQMIEGILIHKYYSTHIPKLTNNLSSTPKLIDFYFNIITKTIAK